MREFFADVTMFLKNSPSSAKKTWKNGGRVFQCHLLFFHSMKGLFLPMLMCASPFCLGVAGEAAAGLEKQLTFAPRNHVLTNVNVWSPDSRWIVYDLRSEDSRFDGTQIERVNVETGEIERLYTSENGSTCGVVTCNPAGPEVIFILSPENPDADWTYAASRRRGLIVDTSNPGKGLDFDAMTYAPPFVPGALRGGSHVHVFNKNGDRVSYTYEDEVLARLDRDPQAPPHAPNQRNVGVSLKLPQKLSVPKTHPRSHDGGWFSVLVTRTVASPKPGSDEISKAFEEGWIGDNGYLRPDGSRQRYALAFQGLVKAEDGSEHAEVFVVDLPEDLTRAGEGSLEGTALAMPSPPAGVQQRRLTFTADRRYPGIQGPRHWLRASPDGSQIAFLMKDDAGIVQIWTVSPNGGAPRQLTRLPWSIESSFTWSPDGSRIAAVADGSVFTFSTEDGSAQRRTRKYPEGRGPSPLACVFSPDGKKIAFLRPIPDKENVFVQVCLVQLNEG